MTTGSVPRGSANSSVESVAGSDNQLDFEWLGGYPRSKGDYMAVSLVDDKRKGKLYNVDDSVTFDNFICERVSQGFTGSWQKLLGKFNL